MSKEDLNYFAEKEKIKQNKFKDFRNKLLLPVSKILMKLGITADMVSYFGLVILVGFIYFAESNPIYASLFLLAHVCIDAFDGPLARLRKEEGNAGAFTDIIADHTGLIIVVCALIYFDLINAVLAAIYIYIYTVLIILIIVRNKMKKPAKIIIRTKWYLYIVYGVWAFFGLNYLTYAVAIFTLAKIPTVISSYLIIKRNLK